MKQSFQNKNKKYAKDLSLYQYLTNFLWLKLKTRYKNKKSEFPKKNNQKKTKRIWISTKMFEFSIKFSLMKQNKSWKKQKQTLCFILSLNPASLDMWEVPFYTSDALVFSSRSFPFNVLTFMYWSVWLYFTTRWRFVIFWLFFPGKYIFICGINVSQITLYHYHFYH